MSRLPATPGQVRLDDLVQVCSNGTEINAALLMEMLGLFIDENARRLEAARDAASAGDDKALRATLHALKGSAALVGADRLRYLAADLEDAVVRATAADAVAATAELQHEFAAVVATLHARYPELASTR
jgi:HPt (histidine-containing phosphotransfer) domain-containing protein